ncbi:hypothetical protein [Niallia sp. 01092]|uniref:hypothetical protein n=1 Tax=unclassified Niallia TaxID=2837522 RepID=UPI003FD58930
MKFAELIKPTVAWEERLEEGDDLFTEENLEATNEVLNAFILQLQNLGENTTDEAVIACVKNVVLRLNEINETFEYFIETMEREELYEFIVEAASIAGLQWEEDITEEWREW